MHGAFDHASHAPQLLVDNYYVDSIISFAWRGLHTCICTNWLKVNLSFCQMDYVGVIKPLFANGGGDVGVESNSLPAELPYSATSLVDHRITLQRGDAVSMQN